MCVRAPTLSKLTARFRAVVLSQADWVSSIERYLTGAIIFRMSRSTSDEFSFASSASALRLHSNLILARMYLDAIILRLCKQSLHTISY